MTSYVYCLYDRQLEVFCPVFEARNDAEFVRMLKNTPEKFDINEFDLYKLARIVKTEDEDTGAALIRLETDGVLQITPLSDLVGVE